MADKVWIGRTLRPADLTAIAEGAPMELCPDASDRMERAVGWMVDDVLADKWRWFGGVEPPERVGDRARAFIEGHCAAVGPALDAKVVRALIAARLQVLAHGSSGCRPVIVRRLIAMLAADVVPVVPSIGSVGAAGGAPLAHVVRVAAGWGGQAWRGGELMSCERAMQGLELLEPGPKEALSLLNGATLTVALAALVVYRSGVLLRTAEAAAALSFDVVRADLGCLSVEALSARGHRHAVQVAFRMCEMLRGSTLCSEGRDPDPFSIRCTPAVLGAAWAALEHIESVVTIELNGACDNPLVLGPGRLVEAGNFHGAPVAMAMDYLKVALTQVASISERRTFRMTYGQLSGLPSFLLPSTGINSGLMLAQYSAASLVSECKTLAHPASVDSLPTVQHREDHVSMGPIAAQGAWRISEALADVLGIELLCGAQALDLHMGGEFAPDPTIEVVPGVGSRATYDVVRRFVVRWDDDRVLHPDLVALGSAVRSSAFVPKR